MADDSADDERHESPRRSTRQKRKPSEWKKQLPMNITRSRARGTNETVPVSSMGGQPSHNLNVDSTNIDNNLIAMTAQILTPAMATAATPPATPPANAKTSGRPYLKRRFRSGWIFENEQYVAPDGQCFASRKEASAYHNLHVPKLEPARKDGWQVWSDEVGSHVDWIAPDGTKLHSFKVAKAYATNTKQPLYGNDGITTGIHAFFARKQQNQTSPSAAKPTRPSKSKPIDLTSPSKAKPTRPSAAKPVDLTSPSAAKPTRPSKTKPTRAPVPLASPNKRRAFSVPQQSRAGLKLQDLCRKIGVASNQHRAPVVSKLEAELKAHITTQSIKPDMTRKVKFMQLLMQLHIVYTHSLSHVLTHSPTYSPTYSPTH